jgi:hypothetical protein
LQVPRVKGFLNSSNKMMWNQQRGDLDFFERWDKCGPQSFHPNWKQNGLNVKRWHHNFIEHGPIDHPKKNQQRIWNKL